MRRALAIALACAAAWSNAWILYVSAGRWDLPGFSAYVVVWTAFLIANASTTPSDLLRERFSPGPGARESVVAAAFLTTLLWSTHLLVAGADVGRLHWSDTVPSIVRMLGFVLLTASLALLAKAIRSNPFFSSVIRVQIERGHGVVSSGPYQFVRHPGYAAAIGIALSSGLALGSWGSLLPSGLVAPLLVWRIRREEALLCSELPGYLEYARSVRYRLLPGVW
jgi:protein-S-isoprenylcysteine O-methyltransferase Ste14